MDEEEKGDVLWGLSSLFLGEERVTTELLPFAIAVPDDDARLFLTTQISDEAKHTVFFDRFYRGSGSLEREGFGLGLAARVGPPPGSH